MDQKSKKKKKGKESLLQTIKRPIHVQEVFTFSFFLFLRFPRNAWGALDLHQSSLWHFYI